MTDKKFQIFISSTYKDLIQAREKLTETILKLYHLPVGMEMFSADDDEQWKVITDTIDMSDYYIVIIGHRYGSETKRGKSFTEKEYDYAKKHEIPILAFIRDRNAPTQPDERDDDPKKKFKLEKFIEKAQRSKMCDFWNNPDELATKVATALMKIFIKNPRIGWIRADRAISPEVSEEIVKLSKENRELRDENEKLSDRLNKNLPNIEVMLNGGSKLDLVYKSNEELDFNYTSYPTPLDETNIPQHLNIYVSTTDIQKYNASLPTNETIDNYNKELELYRRLKITGIDLDISVLNKGNCKANEIYVEIEFPQELKIISKNETKNINPPKYPIPDNPLLAAEKKYEREHSVLGDISSAQRSQAINQLITLYGSQPILHTSNPDRWTKLQNNIITIRLNKLLHTRQTEFQNEYLIVPLTVGTYEAQISMICEEYQEQQYIKFPIEVIKL